ncbi:alginate export family protein [Cerasicoccus maritimus]|uniref:alginate export family protein n=1 Tax=Cerasicoccus maritimus TaxID=490089 RepID=UPI0028528106|nr:alginate export family protein [Cerasicoccus maritimus]
MKNTLKQLTTLTLLGATALSAEIVDFGSAPEKWQNAKPNTELGQKVLGYAGEPALQGRLLYNQRLRFEYADLQGPRTSSNALTLRTRIGYETPKLYGMYLLGEFENTWAINYSDYQAFPGPGTKTIIPDPRNNELNQFFFGFKGWNSDFKGGRQVINLDNQRYVGAVAWRQNDQTFDAIRFQTEIIKDTWLSYAWDWRVNRIFGVYAPVANQERFNSNNHFINAHYEGVPYGKIATYFYYVDLDGSPINSSNTWGLYYAGKAKLSDSLTMPFRAEYALQFDNSASGAGVSYDLNYFHTVLGLNYEGYEAGFGFESLGGNGTRGFRTPLATLHKFNGWADVFLNTPANGLNDYYLYYKVKLPYKFGLGGAFHYFTSEDGGSNTYGKEADISLKRPITENLTALVKFAYYDGHGGPSVPLGSDVTKVWIQLDFKL